MGAEGLTPRPIPVLVVAGFLGSGKTTLVERLLRAAQADGVKLAIVSNEFGDTGIDQALYDQGQDGIVELDGGCVCCRLSDALAETLLALFARATPDRLVLECSGLALPADVLAQFWRKPLRFWTSELVAAVVVDAERAADPGEPDPTWVAQLEAADLVVLNKVDLVDPAALARARARLQTLSHDRPILPAVRCDVDPEVLFPAVPPRADHHHDHHDHDHAAHEALHARYTTHELAVAPGSEPAAVVAAVEAERALRAKGFFRGADGGVWLVQGVGARVEVSRFARAVDEALVGRVVVIRSTGP
jgi:cobalamin biosynthesis protein CobW